MKPISRAVVAITFLCLCGDWSAPIVHGQSDLRGDQDFGSAARGSDSRTAQTKPFEVQFWDFLMRAHYRDWAPAPGTDGSAYAGQSPHGAFLKMYMNRTAVGNPDALPHGSIIIKENYADDGTTLNAITVMYRSKGFDPDNNDWYWIKYLPNGTVDRTPADKGNQPIMGRFAGCIDCHSAATGDDLAFFND